MKTPAFCLTLLLSLAALTGCKSRVIKVSVVNTSAQRVANVAIDYPGGTFGVSSLEPGKTFPYTIKPLDNGPLKVEFTDAAGKRHLASPNTLRRNDEGSLVIKLTQDAVITEPNIVSR